MKTRDVTALLAARVTYSRWGDEEWGCLLGDDISGIPRDGTFYLAALQAELYEVLAARPAYTLGLAASPAVSEKAESMIRGYEIADLDWIVDPFAAADPEAVIAAAKENLVVVGPPLLSRMHMVTYLAAQVIVPPKNEYVAVDRTVRDVLGALEDVKEPALVTLSAGVATPLLVAALHKVVGKKHSLVDVGELWERYLGG